MATKTATRKKSAPKNGRSVRDVAAEMTKLAIEHIDAGVPMWQQPWRSIPMGAPTSLSTGKAYRGMNLLLLMLAAQEKGYGSNLWGTFNQMAERAGCTKVTDEETGRVRWVSPDDQHRGVRKGEKSTEIIWMKRIQVPAKDGAGNPVTDDKGVVKLKSIPILRIFHVFNLEQCDFPDGVKGIKLAERPADFDPIQSAQDLVAGYLTGPNAPSVRHGGSQAFYRPMTDEIHMPQPEDFKSAEHYYSTLFHEITHSSGHSSRLAREGITAGTFGPFGSPVYSTEELVAEMGAAILCALAGINQAEIIPATAAYLKHWRDKLSGDNTLITKAATTAQKAVDHILGITWDDEGTGTEEAPKANEAVTNPLGL